MLRSILILFLLPSTLAQLLNGSCDDPSLCAAKGTCRSGDEPNTFWCDCEAGYGGDLCQSKCDLRCGDGEKCVFDEVTRKPKCSCKDCYDLEPPGLTPDTNPCSPSPCNNGKCVPFGQGFQCICNNGFGGSFCEHGKDHCENHNCTNGSIRTTNDTISFRIDDQLIRRPLDRLHRIQILIPQSVACCLIRSLFLSNSDLDAYTSMATRFVTSSKRKTETTKTTTTTTTTEPPEQNKWSKFTLGKNPTESSTTEPKAIGSWTHSVNKEWSITFVLCSIIVCTIMLFLAVFGTFTVFYLMTKPSGGKSPYSVDA
uniref:EGF-like domain-containing protein n=1 Tax=Caenorhabditis tropicalis TaxID=1561998 RepID=A0A1I7UR54_9PELO